MKLFIFISSLLISAATFAEPIAKIDFLRGEATINGEPVSFPNSLQLGDVVKAWPKTKPKKTGSFIRIVFENGDKIGLSNGSLVIEKYDKKQSIFGLVKGKLFNFAKPGLDRKLSIKTRNVSLAVRGTKYMIEEKANESYICVCEGEVIATKGGRSTPVKAGYDLTLRPGKPINQSVEANEVMLKMVSEAFATLGEPVIPASKDEEDEQSL